MLEKKIKKGDIITVSIDSIGYGGIGIGRYNNITVFIRGGLPGQEVECMVIKKKSNLIEARTETIINESSYYVKPKCSHFDDCGGCSLQHLDYNEQLNQKKQQIIDILERIGKLTDYKINDFNYSENKFHYRNKMEFTFSGKVWYPKDKSIIIENTTFALGLHVPKRYDKVLNIDRCFIQDDRCNRMLKLISDLAIKNSLEPYDIRRHDGFLRTLVIRKSFKNNKIMLNFVTSYKDTSKIDSVFTNELISNFPEISSIINTIHSGKSQTSIGQEEICLFGDSFIMEEVGGFDFKISPTSFFQTNTLQAENLYKIVRKELKGFSNKTIYDLYCGTGTISLIVSKLAKEVIGIELIKSSIENANENKKINKISNVEFIQANLNKFFSTNKSKEINKPDAIIVDPPRAGLHSNAIKNILSLLPEKIIYISCNPSTLARDLNIICTENYNFSTIHPVDMFPHTYHIETVSVINRIT